MSTADGAGGTTEPTGLRRDAEQNRRRLLAAARELFASRGMDVTLHDIARHAGVGVGTAYRRFANKGEVVDALFGAQVQEMSDLVERALADPDPWHGLVTYLEEAMALQARDRGVAQFLSGSRVRPEQHDWSRDVLAPKVEAIAARARDAGLLRADIEGTDLIFIQVGLNAIMERARTASADFYRRYLPLVLDGLRAHPDEPSPLPVPAFSLAQTHAVMGPPAPSTSQPSGKGS